MFLGSGLDFVSGGVQFFIPLVSWTAFPVQAVNTLKQVSPLLFPWQSAQLENDLSSLGAQLVQAAAVDPDGTAMADGGMAPLMGTLPNGAYLSSTPAYYADPLPPLVISFAGAE